MDPPPMPGPFIDLQVSDKGKGKVVAPVSNSVTLCTLVTLP